MFHSKANMIPKAKQSSLREIKKESRLFAKNPSRFLEAGKFTQVDSDSYSALMTTLEDKMKEDKNLNVKAKELEDKYKLSKTRTLLLNMSSTAAFNEKADKGTNTPSNITSSRTCRSKSSKFSSSRASSASVASNRAQNQTPSSGSGKLKLKLKLPEWRRSSSGKAGNLNSNLSLDDNESGFFNQSLDRNNGMELEAAISAFIERIKNSDIDNIILWINTLVCNEEEHLRLPYGYPSSLQLPSDPEALKDPELAAYVSSSLDEFLLLDAEYNAKIEEIGKKLRENFASLQSSRWTPKNSALLFYIITALEDNNNPTFKHELIEKLFPEYGEDQVAMQKYRLRMKRAWEEKRGNIIKDWIRDKEELRRKIDEVWISLKAEFAERALSAQARREQLARCKYWREQVERLRREKRASIRRLKIIVDPYEKSAEAKMRSKLEEEAAWRQYQKQSLNQYKKAAEAKADFEKAERERLQEQLDKNKKEQAKYNESRVLHRKEELEKKMEAQRQLEILKAEERKLRSALLEKIKYKVQLDNYHPSSVLSDTHASLLRNHEVQASFAYDLGDGSLVKFFEQRYGHSFPAEVVTSDRRVRLEGKLREAGLLDSTYARQVLLAMEPKPKPHLVSNIEFNCDNE